MDRIYDIAVLLLSMAKEFVPLIVEGLRGRKPCIIREEPDVRVYRLPQFNLIGKAWTGTHVPNADAADEDSIPCQIYCDPRHNAQGVSEPSREYLPGLWIRYPIEWLAIGEVKYWQIPNTEPRYYKTRHTHIQHEGFPNAYLVALVVQCDHDGNQVYFPGATGEGFVTPGAGNPSIDAPENMVANGGIGAPVGGFDSPWIEGDWHV